MDPAVPRSSKPITIYNRFKDKGMSSKTSKCVDGIFPESYDPALKYKDLEHCARKAGAEGWSCPALKWLWTSPPGETMPAW